MGTLACGQAEEVPILSQIRYLSGLLIPGCPPGALGARDARPSSLESNP